MKKTRYTKKIVFALKQAETGTCVGANRVNPPNVEHSARVHGTMSGWGGPSCFRPVSEPTWSADVF